ncbi:hypothetical protein AWM79_05795 [Pseudomonas agarici]|uniref:Lipoprotein n=1 Tax=Pseudomonas agarici TaxID=46677 RepID=A0A0X1SYD1_PSEAA|nr:hypothetical protein [Pseudomonas agarici]AMB84846.1 hypothetical protein AWM79_05795 [Pseudomonas agarici]NWB90122.1 hypothetical protein [Pseudomonas agarici]NWC09914.1 hypothetical protein [Pseudomonas agarici]SEL56846.1 hypothetical protein SAMN05216604_12282 [Pseudomonas agarici]
MNRLVFGLTPLLVIGLLVVALPADGAVLDPRATATPQLAQNLPNNDNPYNNPIRRANPNSQQGTKPATPPVRGLNTLPTLRPSTLENGAVRNGYPREQQAPTAVPIQPGTRADPNPRR